ncbi:hypothetical protein QJQ45_007518 [Haematococcus lacustris]|nr:hypothetical protein QJQ45_007518 [Haematococcus lacustris]
MRMQTIEEAKWLWLGRILALPYGTAVFIGNGTVIKVPEGAVLRGCKKTRRKLREHLRLRAEIHSQLRFIASLFVLRIFLTCLVGYPTPGSPSAPQPPAVQPPQPPDAPPLPPLPPRAPAQPAQPAQPASMECDSDSDSDSESDCDSDPEPQSDSESESESEPEPVVQPPQRRCSARLAAMAPAAPTGPPLPLDCEDPLMLRQLKDFCKFFANPNFKTCYNQLQRRLVRNRHPMLMPAFEDPSNQALLAKLQELGSIKLTERIVKLYAKAARAKLGWSGEEAQLFIRMACGYGINAHSLELKAATLDKGHVADLIEEANKHRRLLGMKKEGSLQDTLPLPCRMRHAVHVCGWLERWQQPHTPPAPGQPKRGKRRGVGPRTLTCPPPFTLTPMARVGVHFIKVDSRVLHGVCRQLGLTKETRAAFTSVPTLSHHWARWFNTNKLRNKEFLFERLVDTDGVSVCVHYTRPLPPPPAPPPPAASSTSTSSRPSAAAAAAHAVGLPHIGRGIAEVREFVFDPDTQIGVGIDPGVTQAVSAASGVWDPATGQLKADQLRQWKLTKGEVKHASGLNNARRDTERWLAPIRPHLQHLAAASSAGTSLEANLKHITVTLATWDAVWEVYLDPKWARQRLRLYGAQDRALEQFFNKLEEGMEELCMKGHGCAKQLVVFFGAASIGTRGGWGADAVLRACRKVVCRPRGKDQDGGRVVLVDEHRTSRVSSAVNGKQPCEVELNTLSATRPAGWRPPAGQVHHRLVRPAWSQERGQPVRGLVWCPVVAPRRPPQAPHSSQEATQAAASEPGPSTPQPAKRSKRTKAEPGAAEPTKGKGKAAKAKPAPQPGRWLDRDCNAALNMQRIGESRWRPLELCFWPDQGALPAKGKEYPGLGYKRLRDKPPKTQQQQPAEAQWQHRGAAPAKGKEYPALGFKKLRDRAPKAQAQLPRDKQLGAALVGPALEHWICQGLDAGSVDLKVAMHGLFLPGCCLLAVWLWRCTLRLWQHQQSARPASATPTSPTVLAPLPFLGIAPAQLWASTRAAGHRLSVHQAAPSCLAPPPAHSNPAAASATCPPLAADYPNIAAQARLNDLLRLGFTGLLMPAALCLPALALTSGSMLLWLLLRVAWLVLLHLHPDTSCQLPSRALTPHSSDTATASAKQQLKILATAQPTALAGPGCTAGRDYEGQQTAGRRQFAQAGVSPFPPANTPAVVFAAAASCSSPSQGQYQSVAENLVPSILYIATGQSLWAFSRSAQGKQRQARRDSWNTTRRQVIKVPEGAVLRGCKKTRRKLREHLRLRAEIHSQLRFIASLFVLRIFLTCLVGYPTPGSPSAPQPPAVQPPQPPDAPPLPPLPPRAPAQPAQPAQPASMECDSDSDSESDCDSDPEPQSDSESDSESEPEPVVQPPQRRCSARLAAMAPAAPTGPPLPLDCEDPLMLRQLKDFCKFFANPNFKTCYNQLQRRLVRNRHPMLMPAFEDPSNQALVAKLQELGSIYLAGDANTIDAHSMRTLHASQHHSQAEQGALPAKGKEYPGLGYKRLRGKPPKAQEQQQQPAEAQ